MNCGQSANAGGDDLFIVERADTEVCPYNSLVICCVGSLAKRRPDTISDTVRSHPAFAVQDLTEHSNVERMFISDVQNARFPRPAEL